MMQISILTRFRDVMCPCILADAVVFRTCYFSHYTKWSTQLVSSRNVEKFRILILCVFKEKYFKTSSLLLCYELSIMRYVQTESGLS